MSSRLLHSNEALLLFLLVILMIVLSMVNVNFLTVGNLLQVTIQMVELSIITFGMVAVIITGGIDLSIGSITGLTSIVIGNALVNGINMWVAILLGLILAILCGLLNGVLVGKFNIPAILVTLGTSTLFGGVAVILCKGRAVSGFPDEYFIFGQGYFGPIPLQVVILLALFTIVYVMLNHTKWGRRIYLIGSNPTAARFSGIDCEKNLILTYLFSSLMGFVTAVILTSRVATARADLGDQYVLQSVSAAVFGGISIYGGEGNIGGSLIGVAIFTIISNGLNLMGVSPFIQQIVAGIVLLGVLTIRILSTRVGLHEQRR